MIIVDCHTHIRNVEDGFAPLYKMAERLGYAQLTVLSLQSKGDLLQNITCGLCKALRPQMTYAFAGLDYATGRDFAQQAMRMRAMGFDGMKMLEGKPTTRRQLGNALDDPKYDAYYDYLEQTGFPVLFHVVDPPEFWDRDKVPDWAVEQGWFYDQTDVPYAQYYDEVERMLDKHPKLRAIFAHFFFLSGDPDRAQKFLDDHPCVSIDLTAGIEMYENFSKDPAFWRTFFIKNSDRIIFGTDSTDEKDLLDSAMSERVEVSGYAGMEIEFLRYDHEIALYGKVLHGLGLPKDVQARVFAENFHALVGTAPQKMDVGALMKEAEFVRGFLSSGDDVLLLDHIVSRLASLAPC